jgi:hypothetical protein
MTRATINSRVKGASYSWIYFMKSVLNPPSPALQVTCCILGGRNQPIIDKPTRTFTRLIEHVD